jgi:DNA-binding PadR family transcriptional regulator
MRTSEKLEAGILTLLLTMPTYGYDLRAPLVALGLPYYANGDAIYRALHALEKDGMVTRRWDIPEAGPARLIYTITEAGVAYLQRVGMLR